MPKKFQVWLNEKNKDIEGNISTLYKHNPKLNGSQTQLLRKLTADAVEGLFHGSQDVKSSRQEKEVRLLKEFECPVRCPIEHYHRPTKQWLQKVRCFNPRTKESLGTNLLEIEECKWCYDNGGTANLLALTEPKKEVSKPTPKTKPTVTKQEYRECENPNCDLMVKSRPSKFKEGSYYIPRYCNTCWHISKKAGFQGWNKPISGMLIKSDYSGKLNLSIEEEPREPVFDSFGNKMSDAEISTRFHETNETRQSHDEWEAERAQRDLDKLSAEIREELEQEKEE